MRVLGALIAGGRSVRFGSDKARARVSGQAMLDHVIAGVAPQVDALVICGRSWPGLAMLEDRPAGRLGPLAGLNAALRHAAGEGYDAVLSVPVDVLPIPADMAARLRGTGAAVFRTQHLIGWWPTSLATALDAHLAGGSLSVGSWIAASGARRVDEPCAMRNVNFPEDLE